MLVCLNRKSLVMVRCMHYSDDAGEDADDDDEDDCL